MLAHCPVSAVVNLSSTCRSSRNFFMAPKVLNTILRAAMLSPTGSLRWLLPVRSINDETERATLAAREWLTSKYALVGTVASSLSNQSIDSSPPFVQPSFPFHVFVPACLSVNTTLSSMSMSNRRRLWDIVQQFEVVWRDYRTKGWERGELFSMFDGDEI